MAALIDSYVAGTSKPMNRNAFAERRFMGGHIEGSTVALAVALGFFGSHKKPK